MGFVKEFKEFAMKGNVIDLAVAVIIGGAFGKIVSSFVADIVMPLIGLLLGGVNFADLKWVIKEAVMENGVEKVAAATLNYGNFIQETVNFLIIAFCIFLVIRGIAKASNALPKKKEEAAKVAPASKPDDVKLLEEIRDLIKNN